MTQTTPKGVILAVILILGLVAVGGLGGIIWLASTHTAIPTTLEVITSAALGAVSGVLATTRTNPDPVDQVPVPGPAGPPGPAGLDSVTVTGLTTGGEYVPEPPAGPVGEQGPPAH